MHVTIATLIVLAQTRFHDAIEDGALTTSAVVTSKHVDTCSLPAHTWPLTFIVVYNKEDGN